MLQKFQNVGIDPKALSPKPNMQSFLSTYDCFQKGVIYYEQVKFDETITVASVDTFESISNRKTATEAR